LESRGSSVETELFSKSIQHKDGWMDDGWMDEWMDGWMGGWMD